MNFYTAEEYARKLRSNIVAALIPPSGGSGSGGDGGGGIPVLPVVEIVFEYLKQYPFVSEVSAEPAIGDPLSQPTRVYPYPNRPGCWLLSDSHNHRFASLLDGVVVMFTGPKTPGQERPRPGYANGYLSACAYHYPTAIAVDPHNSNRFYISDFYTVRAMNNTADGMVTTIAGSDAYGYSDGTGSAATFNTVTDLLCTSDGQTLLAADQQNNSLRCIDIKTREVTTVAGEGPKPKDMVEYVPPKSAALKAAAVNRSLLYLPHAIAFNRQRGVKPESELFIAWNSGIKRFNRITGEIRDIELDRAIEARGLYCLSNGLLIYACVDHHSIFTLNPTTGDTELLAGSGSREPDDVHRNGYINGAAVPKARFNRPIGVYVNEDESFALIADQNNDCIRRITLSPHLFADAIPPRVHVPLEREPPPVPAPGSVRPRSSKSFASAAVIAQLKATAIPPAAKQPSSGGCIVS